MLATNFVAASLLLLLVGCIFIEAADHSNFKTCEQSGFCKRNRNLNPDVNRWSIVDQSVNLGSDGESVLFDLKNVETGVLYKATLSALLSGQTFRLRVDESAVSLKPRFDAKDVVLLPNLKSSKVSIDYKSSSGFTVETTDEINKKTNKIVVSTNPFRLDVFSGDDLVISGNQRGLFNFEHYRPKPRDGEPNDCTADCWEEGFKGSTDSKPFGPMSVGMDFSFVGFEHVYGIPSHADSFSLRNTKGTMDPYRLYNVDIFEYEVNSPMSLYGANPLMIAHSTQPKTVGLFWLNPSETWIDIESSNAGLSGLISGFVSEQKPTKLTHWISETGIVDVFFLLGPSAAEVMAQNAKLTGVTPLPPIYSLGYHQCRWNYFTTEEVMDVDAKADLYDIPMDSIWLDVEYTEGRSKKYFTWDPVTFHNHQGMIQNLTNKGRRLIAIIDPHLKKDSGYSVYNEAQANGYLTKDGKEDKDYEGWCWPGSSAWADFLNPVVRDWWSDKFDPKFFPGFENGIVDIWNDMNEPSVFSGPEITSPRDMKHFGNIENREIHNIYGLLMTKSTFDGLVKHRSNLRPFILSRSFFSGSQRNVAVWTGDNMSKWEHLKMVIPMLLSHSVTGITFIGADIPGFFFNPESEEMVIRWYQSSVLHPFFRAHAHLDTKRREPWLFSDFTRNAIRDVLRLRYNYMPYLYQNFYQNEQNGMPPMRPLWFQFPTDSRTLPIDNAYLVGSDLLVYPVLDKEVKTLDIYLPSEATEQTSWLDVFNNHVYRGGLDYQLEVNIHTIPIFQRSGSIIPKRERLRRAAVLAVNDPISLSIFLSSNGSASGFLYLDDGQSYDYRNKNAFISGKFSYAKRTLSYQFEAGSPESNNAWLERVTIVGYPSKPNRIQWQLTGDNVNNQQQSPQQQDSNKSSGQLAFKYEPNQYKLVIRKPAIGFGQNWQIKIL